MTIPALWRIIAASHFILLSACVACAADDALASGETLRVGGNQRGPLSSGLSNYPVGIARVYGGSSPDMFIAAGRFSHDPGLFLYRWVATDSTGAPVFGSREPVKFPGGGSVPPTGTIFQTKTGAIYGFWIIKGVIVRTRFDHEQLSFVPLPLPSLSFTGENASAQLNPDNRSAERLVTLENLDGSLEIIFSVSDGTRFRPPEPPGSRDPAFHAFNGAGIWRGGWPYVFLRSGHLAGPEANVSTLSTLGQISATQREALLSHGSLAIANLGPRHTRDIITGSHFGNFYYYHNKADSGVALEPQQLVRDPESRVIRNPIISASPVAYPSADGFSDLIAGGEGALSFYRFAGFDREQRPTFAAPVPILEEHAQLYAGSLPVINAVDWDGDGAIDLVVGNSEGKILFFHNRGTTAQPAFDPAIPLESAGEVIQVETGYWSIQGPGEARWGYSSPSVADWNGDGLLDLLVSDASAHHVLYRNLGTKTSPRLDRARPIFCEGVDLHGSWRVRPGVARWNNQMAYVTLDDDDQFHRYERIDDFNLRDVGKLRLEDGSPISANFLAAGGTGRSKITIVDWDGDGKLDLIVGTPRHGSVPNAKTGLPQSRGLPGSAVLWLRNTGRDAEPRFALPEILQFRGKPLYFGQHECSVAVSTLGGSGELNLLVGDEEGRIHFYRRADLSWSR